LSVVALIEFYFKLIICITIPEEPNLAAFLNLDTVEKLASKRATGGTRPALDYPALFSIPVISDRRIYEKIQDAVAKKKQKELEAQQLLDSIDDYLLGELGIELPEPEKNTIQNRIFIRNLSEVSGDRFDPYSYQNKFKYLENKLKSMPIKVKKLKDIVSFFDYGLMPTQDYAFSDADGLPMIRVTNIKKDGYIDMSDIKYIKFDTPRLYQKLVKANDILMVQCGNTTGKCAFVTEEYEGYTFGSFSFVIRGDRNYVDQKYLFNILSSIVVQEQLNKSLTITSVRPNTSKPDVLNFKIPLPPLEKQIEISEHITAIRNQAKQLQQQAKDDLEKAKQEVEAMILGDD
jgi:type I restriction enzyme M protein